jgi:hypothetical protein
MFLLLIFGFIYFIRYLFHFYVFFNSIFLFSLRYGVTLILYPVKISIEAAMEGTLHSQRLRWNCHRQAHTTGTSSRGIVYLLGFGFHGFHQCFV